MDLLYVVFMPKPNVDLSVLKLVVRDSPPVQVDDEDYFFAIVRACFMHRRKTIKNNLASYFKNKYTKGEIEEVLKTASVDGIGREESLQIYEFAYLANSLFRLTSNI